MGRQAHTAVHATGASDTHVRRGIRIAFPVRVRVLVLVLGLVLVLLLSPEERHGGPAGLPVCLPVCLPACLPACLPVCLVAFAFGWSDSNA